jgi:predicted acyl esterase
MPVASGVSFLVYGGTQWRVAARKPKGLTCIIPWEGTRAILSVFLHSTHSAKSLEVEADIVSRKPGDEPTPRSSTRTTTWETPHPDVSPVFSTRFLSVCEALTFG